MIRDNPSFKSLDNMMKAMKTLAKLRPVLRLFGKSGRRMANALDKVPGLAEQTEALLSLPDRFSRILGPRGWIAHEDIHFETMRMATEIAEAGRVDEAEAILTAHYGADTIRTWLRFFLTSVRAYHPRHELMLAAAKDHEEGRFHASVPVVLAQMDGLVLDLANLQFFRRGGRAHLEAADSMAGHPRGLGALAALMGQPRSSTRTTVIDLPYRHGILHGRDLGYANETTSAKAFAAFLALRAWAMKVERGAQFEAPPVEWPDPQTMSWRDIGRVWKDAWKSLLEYAESRRQPRSPDNGGKGTSPGGRG